MYSEDLAAIHHDGFSRFATDAAPGILSTLWKAGIRSGLIVDLGCGSGVWLRELTRAGYRGLGVDTSAAMIDMARKIAPAAKFRTASIPVRLPRCDAVTAIGEVLSYRTKGQDSTLRASLHAVAASLRPGGLFLFDVLVASGGPPMRYRSWSEGDSWTILVEVQEEIARRRLTRDITTFRRVGKVFRRRRERHTLEIVDRNEVEALLRQMGFRVRVSRRYGSLTLPPRRLAFIARKH